jgi:hypothetical protein
MAQCYASTTIASGDSSFSALMATCTSMRNASTLLMQQRKQQESGFQSYLDERRDRTQHLPVRSPLTHYVTLYYLVSQNYKAKTSIKHYLPPTHTKLLFRGKNKENQLIRLSSNVTD